ncbi:F-box/kelch-repeat protein At3g23880 isoform X2 [Ricinus communis]|uniref:F-box/kelch-repeat protein At3g23880 isoform X2 n=1 Tax=Ricinus communis TaxID=3988 RepID=UPI0007724667|nr:F-box/kelch-repeat protein At3g23880 isoform X2 [Ricinus communis]XP_048235562.1 F-box/kelch-repeat protein At3g23880 isoform X2 [Ricinus communis]|eukprot:XP_015573331.1 F-box/kelch-repeat protein At3g23880 isoform X2 [Ricinus communis]
MAEKKKELVMVTDSTHRRPTKRLNEDQYHSLVDETETPQKKAKKLVPQQSDNISFSLPVLPHEIIVEIISRLPVKTLIQFRCVSKSFKTLISDTQFIKTHLRKITSFSKIKKPSLYQKITPNITFSPFSFFKSCSLYSIFDNSLNDPIELNSYFLEKRFQCDWLVGSCDGLICFSVKQDFVTLLNPSTRVFNRLPNLGFGRKSGSYSVFGFGYDSEIDDYKVVAVFCFQNKNSSVGFGYESIVKVCTLRTNCWRRTGSFGYGVPYDVSGKYVNCTLNWPVMSEGDSGLMWIIVSFDIKRETYKEVMQPDYGELVYDRTLGVLDGCLCVMCNYHAVRADFWVMKEYGVRESWIRLVTVPYLDYPGSLHLQYSVPYAIADNEVYIDSLVSPKVEI